MRNLIFVFTLFCLSISAKAQQIVPAKEILYYNVDGHEYKWYRFSRASVSLYRSTTWAVEERQKYKTGGNPGLDMIPVTDIIIVPSDFEEKMEEIYREVFTQQQRKMAEGTELNVFIYLTDQGEIIGTEFMFEETDNTYVNFPLEQYSLFEDMIKENLRFETTQEGKRRNYLRLVYFWE